MSSIYIDLPLVIKLAECFLLCNCLCFYRTSLAVPHTDRGLPAELSALSVSRCQHFTQALHDTSTYQRYAPHAAAPHIIGWSGTRSFQPGPSKHIHIMYVDALPNDHVI